MNHGIAERATNLGFFGLAYWYAYKIRPGLLGKSMHIALRVLSRRANYRVDQRGYEEIVRIAEYRVATALYKRYENGYKPTQFAQVPARAERSTQRGGPPVLSAARLLKPTRAPGVANEATQMLFRKGVRMTGPTGRS